MKKLPIDFSLEKYGLYCRFVNESDAEFIVRLRNDDKLSRYIHSSCQDVESQKEWIREYKEREKVGTEYYMIFFKDGKRVGLNRIYKIHEGVFTTGSWLFEKDAPFECSVLASIIGREIAFDQLGLDFENAYDGVHVDNKKVIKFNHMMGLKDGRHFQDEKGEYIAQSLTKDDFHANKDRILKLLGYK